MTIFCNDALYTKYRNRFADKLRAIDQRDPLAGYNGDAARKARTALVERQRRIDSTPSHLLAYDEFLDSLYWISLSDWLKHRANYRCQAPGCGIRPRAKHPGAFSFGEGLNVHHKTYAHRGFEYPNHLDDLEVLCAECHRRAHGLGNAGGKEGS